MGLAYNGKRTWIRLLCLLRYIKIYLTKINFSSPHNTKFIEGLLDNVFVFYSLLDAVCLLGHKNTYFTQIPNNRLKQSSNYMYLL